MINHDDHVALNLARRPAFGGAAAQRRRAAVRAGQGKIAVVGPSGGRRPDPARRLGGLVRSGGLAARRPAARHDHDGAGRSARPRRRHVRAGADILTLEPDPAGETFPDGQPRPAIVRAVPAGRGADRRGRRAAARDADYVVAVVGDRIELVGEGRSTATLDLIGGQIALLDALAETGTPMIVVLLASKPLVLPRVGAQRRRAAVGGQPRHAGWPGDRRDPARRGRAERPPADLVRGDTSGSSRPTTTRSVASTAPATPTTRRSRRSRSARACPTRPSSTASCWWSRRCCTPTRPCRPRSR